MPQPDASPQQSSSPADNKGARKPIKVGDTFEAKKLDTPLDKMTRERAGKRSYTRTERKRGRYIKARPAGDHPQDIAFDATLRAAAPFQRERHAEGENDMALQLRKGDLQRKVRVRRTGNLILFVVDASWSMAASERMEATKGAIFSLLVDAYQRRDQVGLIVFQRDRARLVLPPTSSVDLAQKALTDLPVGGKTPLSSGLFLAWQVLDAARRRDSEIRPIMILLTDGAGNVSMTGLPAAGGGRAHRRPLRPGQFPLHRHQHGARVFRPRAGAEAGRRAGRYVLQPARPARRHVAPHRETRNKSLRSYL
jgi:Mg-chelatase subunit ChlD